MSEGISQIFSRSQALHQAGHLPEAEAGYRQILAAHPNHADSIHMLGVLAHQTGRQQVALDLIQRAIALNNSSAEYFSNLSLVFSGLGRNQDALAALNRALALNPNDPAALANFASTLIDLGQYAEAAAAARRIIELRPKFHLGYFNLGNAERLLENLEESAKAYETAIALMPGYLEALANLANVYYTLRNLDRALACWDRILEIDPQYALARWNRSYALLMRGDYQRGLEEYEWRFRVPDTGVVTPDFGRPRWNGQNPRGKTLGLFVEGGFGDALRFVRYAPMVADLGATVILLCHRELLHLLKSVRGISAAFAHGDPLPACDWQISLSSLPGIFKTRVDSIPAQVPYVHADPVKTQYWKSRIAGENRLKVGLAWAGRPVPRHRFIPPQLLAPLANIPGIQFFSLQKPEDSAVTENPPLPITDWTAELKDFSDTAALAANMDLIITIDSSVAHLAGAMGRPTWVMLKFVPHWPWMLDRADSPWYPTARLFRQQRINDWQAPIDELVAALRQKARE